MKTKTKQCNLICMIYFNKTFYEYIQLKLICFRAMLIYKFIIYHIVKLSINYLVFCLRSNLKNYQNCHLSLLG